MSAGCATLKPKNFAEYKEGEWSGKVLIRHKKESKSGIVNIKVKAISGEKMRIDVTSNIGTHIASVWLEGNQFTYLNIKDKTLTKTQANANSLKDILALPFEPKYLYSVFFDQSISEKNWECVSDASGLVKSCRDKKTGVKIDWLTRDGERRTIAFDHAAVSVQMSLFDFEDKVTKPEKVFEVKAPPSFKVKQI